MRARRYVKCPAEETFEIFVGSSVTIFHRLRLCNQLPRHEGAAKKKESQFMKMHKVSLLAALAAGAFIAFTPTLRAENKPDRPNRSERPGGGGPGQRGDMLKKMAEELGLSEKQKSKLQETFKEQREAMKDLTPEARRDKMKETREAMNAKMKEILTAEQYSKWEKIRDERRPGRPGSPGAGPANGGGDGEKRGPGSKKKN